MAALRINLSTARFERVLDAESTHLSLLLLLATVSVEGRSGDGLSRVDDVDSKTSFQPAIGPSKREDRWPV